MRPASWWGSKPAPGRGRAGAGFDPHQEAGRTGGRQRPSEPRAKRAQPRNSRIPCEGADGRKHPGSDYRVIASVGHVRDLPNYGYGVEDIKSEKFDPKYVPI